MPIQIGRRSSRPTGTGFRARAQAVFGLLALAVVAATTLSCRPLLILHPLQFLQAQASHLASTEDPQVARLLVAMGDRNVELAVRARDALTRRGQPVVQPLIDRLRHPEPRVRAAAALVLGNISDARAVGPLSNVLDDPDALVRYRAVYALAHLKDPRAVPALASRLLDPAPEIVPVTLRALEECQCKVRVRASGADYEILPPGQTEWQVVAANRAAE